MSYSSLHVMSMRRTCSGGMRTTTGSGSGSGSGSGPGSGTGTDAGSVTVPRDSSRRVAASACFTTGRYPSRGGRWDTKRRLSSDDDSHRDRRGGAPPYAVAATVAARRANLAKARNGARRFGCPKSASSSSTRVRRGLRERLHLRRRLRFHLRAGSNLSPACPRLRPPSRRPSSSSSSSRASRVFVFVSARRSPRDRTHPRDDGFTEDSIQRFASRASLRVVASQEVRRARRARPRRFVVVVVVHRELRRVESVRVSLLHASGKTSRSASMMSGDASRRMAT